MGRVPILKEKVVEDALEAPWKCPGIHLITFDERNKTLVSYALKRARR